MPQERRAQRKGARADTSTNVCRRRSVGQRGAPPTADVGASDFRSPAEVCRAERSPHRAYDYISLSLYLYNYIHM